MSSRAPIGGASVAAVALAVPSQAAAVSVAFPAKWHALIAGCRRINADARAARNRFNAAERALRRAAAARAREGMPVVCDHEHMTIAQIRAMPLGLFGRG